MPPSIQVTTILVEPKPTGFNVRPYINNYNNIKIDDLDHILAECRKEAQSTVAAGGYSLSPQTILIAEEPFPCYERI